MLHVSAIQGHLQATLMLGVLLHCALLEYLLFSMSVLVSSCWHVLSVPLRSLYVYT
jgi:hypothetical protein